MDKLNKNETITVLLESIVNHLIHRDNTIIGGEVHIDIFDDRIEFNSPGGMFDGTLIQNRDISKVPSVRRNPILADVFTHLEYMEKRGSGLRKICDLSARLDGYKEELHPEFTSEANVFYTTIKNVNYPHKDGKWVVKVGSSNAKVGSSTDKVDNSSPENHHPVDIYGASKRLSRKVLSENIMQFCSEWRTPDDISVYTGKDLRYIKEKVLSSLVKSGLLERLYPDTPNHPKQKYRSKR